MLRLALLITSLNLACGSLPKPPPHIQWGVYPNVNPPGFYGVHNETKKRYYLPFNSQTMSGGQALTASHFKAWQKWVAEVKRQAERRCD